MPRVTAILMVQGCAARRTELRYKRLRAARRLSRLLEKNWVHCRPRPGSAVLIGVAFRRRLTGSTVKRATRPPWLCILCQRACRNAQARISPNKKDDATTTAKQTGVHTLQHFLVDVLNGVPRRNSGRALRSFPAFAASDAPNVIGPQGKRSGFYHRVGCIGTHAR